MSISKEHENTGMLEFLQGKGAFAADKYEDAANHYRKAAVSYALAEQNPTNKENLQKSYLNQGAALIDAGSPKEALGALNLAKKAGMESEELTKNMAAAHYNHASKIYKNGLDLQLDKKHDAAIVAFNTVVENLEFPLEFRLNSFCKLIECNIAIPNLLDQDLINNAVDAFNALGNFTTDASKTELYKTWASFVYDRVESQYLVQQKVQAAHELLVLIDAKHEGLGLAAQVAQDVEQIALATNATGDHKGALNMLLTLANAIEKTAVPTELIEHLKYDMSNIVQSNYAGEKGEEFIKNILQGHFDYDNLSPVLGEGASGAE